MKDSEANEQRLIEELIEELAPDGPMSEDPSASARRELRDVLGLLPYALDPVTPAADARRRLLEEIGAPSQAAAPIALPAGRRPKGGVARWALPLAATLAIALAGTVAWQQVLLQGEEAAIVSLESEVERLGSERDELAQSRAMLARRQAQLAMVTEPGAEFCLLTPYGERPQFPRARATFVVGAQRERWFLRGERLDPCEQGRAYKIWFETESGAVPGPSFRVDGPDAEIEIYQEGVPEGVLAISVTLEHDPDCERPEGPTVLRADRPIRLL